MKTTLITSVASLAFAPLVLAQTTTTSVETELNQAAAATENAVDATADATADAADATTDAAADAADATADAAETAAEETAEAADAAADATVDATVTAADATVDAVETTTETTVDVADAAVDETAEAAALTAGDATTAPTIGAAAPAFTLKDAAGAEHSLADHAGKIVVLEWVNFECPFVRAQYDSGKLPALQERYTSGDDGVIWLTINSSAAGEQGHLEGAAYSDKAGHAGWKGSALLQDADGTVGKLYHAATTPHVFVIDAEGKLAYAGAVDDKPTTNKDEVGSGSINYVSAAIDALRAGEAVATAETEAYGCPVKY